MVVFVVAMLDFIDEPAYRRYQAAFPAVFRKFSGTILAADEAPLIVEGRRPAPSKVVIIRFPSPAEAIRFLTGPDYGEISEDRHKGAITFSVLVHGLASALVNEGTEATEP